MNHQIQNATNEDGIEGLLNAVSVFNQILQKVMPVEQ